MIYKIDYQGKFYDLDSETKTRLKVKREDGSTISFMKHSWSAVAPDGGMCVVLKSEADYIRYKAKQEDNNQRKELAKNYHQAIYELSQINLKNSFASDALTARANMTDLQDLDAAVQMLNNALRILNKSSERKAPKHSELKQDFEQAVKHVMVLNGIEIARINGLKEEVFNPYSATLEFLHGLAFQDTFATNVLIKGPRLKADPKPPKVEFNDYMELYRQLSKIIIGVMERISLREQGKPIPCFECYATPRIQKDQYGHHFDCVEGCGRRGPEGDDELDALEAWNCTLKKEDDVLREIWFIIESALKPEKQELYYIQDSRSIVGNCIQFWCIGNNGYHSELSRARTFTREEAIKITSSRASDVAWPKAYIDKLAGPTVDHQYLDKAKAGVK